MTKNEWFTSVELGEIRRRMTTVDDAGCMDSEPEPVVELNGNVNVQLTDK